MLRVYAPPGIDCGSVQLNKTQLKAPTLDAEAKACKSRLSHVSGTQISLVSIVAPDWIAHAKTVMSSSASGPSRCSTQDSTRPLFNRPSHPQQPYQTNLTSCALSVSSTSMHARCHFREQTFLPGIQVWSVIDLVPLPLRVFPKSRVAIATQASQRSALKKRNRAVVT